MIYNSSRALQLLRLGSGQPNASFREGQQEAIRHIVGGRSRLLVVHAALVVNSDHLKGGTWAGAVEQLEKLHLVPVYVRTDGERGKGLDALRAKGALPWPNPMTSESFVETLTGKTNGAGELSNNKQLSLLET